MLDILEFSSAFEMKGGKRLCAEEPNVLFAARRIIFLLFWVFIISALIENNFHFFNIFTGMANLYLSHHVHVITAPSSREESTSIEPWRSEFIAQNLRMFLDRSADSSKHERSRDGFSIA